MAELKVIVGLGKTGYSCAEYFRRHGVPFSVVDANPEPPYLAALRELAPDVQFGGMDADVLSAAEELVVSPGVPLSTPEIQAAIGAGVPVTGDVAMFAELADAPMVAITGSNGKSTVTALVGEMARHAGVNAGVGGNIGLPCIDLLGKGFDLYVIEVSSYQLETASYLPCKVAVVLTLSPDHMDRYPSLESYYGTKAGIYSNCEIAVVNRDIDYPFDTQAALRVVSFGAGEPVGRDDFGLRQSEGKLVLAHGDSDLMPVDELPIKGGHNQLNALAALAIGTALGWDIRAMLEALRQFKGLAHRCEWVAEINGVEYINDSKATNIGSTLAAVYGLAGDKKHLILILGGQGKGADFSQLVDAVSAHVKQLYVFGGDRERITTQLGDVAPTRVFENLEAVVSDIKATAVSGDRVLFSPACASLDQFRNFEARGDAFKAWVIGEAQS